MERADFGQWSAKDVARLLALLEAQLGYYREIAAVLPIPLAIVSKDRSVVWTNRAFRTQFGTRTGDLRGSTEIPLRAWHDEDEAETLLVFDEPPQQAPPAAADLGTMPPVAARKQRFDALYSFAGRLAHDLNNPLMIVTGYTEELMKALKPEDPLRGEAGEILDAARRIGGIAAQLTEFARPQGKPASRVNIGDAILNLRSKIVAAAGERVAVELTVNRTPILAMADPEQLGEVLATVIAGPAGAPQQGVPRERTRITIAWDVETDAEARKYARITVRDDGNGFDPKQAAGVFDPVLSKTGDTSGLVLARAYSIVRQWGGDIAFASEHGKGSTFAIYLPYAEAERAPAVRAEQRRAEVPTILVVDDESGIRDLIRKILQREGYAVLEAGTAEEALTIAQSQSIDLLITDVMLPGIHGPELARRIQQKTLFISGYTGDERVPAGAPFLAKPFTLPALLKKVRETLGA